MAEDLISNTGEAAIAYRDALTAARNTQNALLRQYGFTMPAAGGGYSVESAQTAFDPNTLFDKATGGIDAAKVAALAGRVQIGGTGLLSDIQRGGASTEAEAVLGSRAAGIAGGGLAAQRRALAEAQTAGQLGQAKQQFISSIAEGLAPVSGAYAGLEKAQAYDKFLAEQAAALRGTMPTVGESPVSESAVPSEPKGTISVGERAAYTKPGTPRGVSVPARPKPGQTVKGQAGVNWVYRPKGPKGPGWYKK